MQNHISIGHLRSWILVGNMALGVSAFSFSIFFLVRHERNVGIKIGLVTKEVIASRIPSHGCFSFLSCWWPFCIFCFCFLPIFDREFSSSFAFLQSLIGNFLFTFGFPPIFDWEFSLFPLLSEAHSQLKSKWNSFLGAPPVLSSEGKGKNSYPGSRFMAKGLRFWLKGLQKARHGVCQGICLASGSGISECPILFPWHAYNNDDLENYAKLIMPAPMWTLKHQALWPCNTKAYGSFSLFKSCQCSQKMLFYQFMHTSKSI